MDHDRYRREHGMIVNYTYRLNNVGVHDAQERISEFADRLIRARPYLLDYTITPSGNWLYVNLRLTDIDRWRIKAHADKTITSMAMRARIKKQDIELYGMAEVANRRGLLEGEGRTPRPRRPRSKEPVASASLPESSAL
jgi:hypothetical protein